VEGLLRGLAPGLVGVVLQPVGGRHDQLVREAHPVDDRALGVDGDRLDRGRADVDADGDLAPDLRPIPTAPSDLAVM
jgi:hypothetical protein